MSSSYPSLEKSNVEDLLQELILNVDALTSSKQYRDYLKVATHFPTYSVHNLLLIFKQFPQATFVAGYATWKSFGRHVKKGEKGIKILAPITQTQTVIDEVTQLATKETTVGFRRVCVFDISQTEGRPLPKIMKPKTLHGECDIYDEAKNRLETALGYHIQPAKLEAGATGKCSYESKTIYIHDTCDSRQAFKTMIHECAHVFLHEKLRLHTPTNDFEKLLASKQSIREMEAESVSYIVCSRMGIDCSEYSFPYIALWKKKESFLVQSLKRITNISLTMIQLLDDLANTEASIQDRVETSQNQQHPQNVIQTQESLLDSLIPPLIPSSTIPTIRS